MAAGNLEFTGTTTRPARIIPKKLAIYSALLSPMIATLLPRFNAKRSKPLATEFANASRSAKEYSLGE